MSIFGLYVCEDYEMNVYSALIGAELSARCNHACQKPFAKYQSTGSKTSEATNIQ